MTQVELVAQLVAVLERTQIPYAIVGSFASSIWGEPRMTLDIDVVVQLRLAHVEAVVGAFPAPAFYVSRAAVDEAIRMKRPFDVIHNASGNKVDFMVVGHSGWAANQLARRRKVQILPELHAYIAAPDDVILGKLVYFQEGGSDKHLRDIAGILKRSGDLVDRDYVMRTALALGVSDAWRQVTAETAGA